MKTYVGSLQRRGNRYYLVIHKDGHQRWLSLKTGKLPIARMRASRIAPPDPNNERAWLEQLVRVGEAARLQLARQNIGFELTWENLADRAAATVDLFSSADTRACHMRWLSLLAEQVQSQPRSATPGTLMAVDAASAMTALSSEYRSYPRMLTFFQRLWAGIGLDASIWQIRIMAGSRLRGEHYRRLRTDEVRAVYNSLQMSAPDLADMVLIGYSTGLRLSDVAELELGELSLPFLRIVPNKTRKRKPNPLRIPLTAEALTVLTRLKEKAERVGETFLFDAATRHRPSRRLAAAFRRAGVVKQDSGRASFHSLRATFISLMDEAGVPPHLTDAITGHGGGGMHARYTQPSDDALYAAIVRAIPPLNPVRIDRRRTVDGRRCGRDVGECAAESCPTERGK